MKKLFTLHSALFTLLLFATTTASAQDENYFDAEDLDANGWLWFDTQAKIDKYVGWDDKKILLVPATYETEEGENPEPYASPTVKGAGTDEEATIGGPNCKTGAIVLCESNGINAQTGGAIMLQMPSCHDMALFLSSEGRMLTVLTGGVGKCETIDLQMIQGKCAAPFLKLAPAGQFTYSNMAQVENANTGFKLYSNNAMTGCFRNCNVEPLYIHGIKVMVKKGDGGSTTTVKYGDANKDGNVDVADITAIASYILGTTPAQWNKTAADANKDGNIDVADITTTAGIILSK